jgi:hypothetical protein
MWSWVGLSRDTAESRSAPRVTAVTSFRDGVRCVLGRALRRFGCHGRGPHPSRLGDLPRPVQCLVDEGKHRGVPERSTSISSGSDSIGSFQFRDAKRFKRVDVIGTLPMIVEPKEADCDAVGREVGNDITVPVRPHPTR